MCFCLQRAFRVEVAAARGSLTREYSDSAEEERFCFGCSSS